MSVEVLICILFIGFHSIYWVLWVLCLISAIHSMMLLLCLLCCYLLKEEKGKRVNCWCMSFVCLLLSSPPILRPASVVFDFNDSINDVTPISPTKLPVETREKSELLMDFFCVSSFLCLYHSDWVLWVLCLFSVIHSMMLLLCLQCYSLLRKKVNCWWMSFVYVFLLFLLHRLSSMSDVFDFNDSINDNVPVSPIKFPACIKWKKNSDLLMHVIYVSFVFTVQIEFLECWVWLQWFTQWYCSCVPNVVTCLCKE